jgi:hypothetical protein
MVMHYICITTAPCYACLKHPSRVAEKYFSPSLKGRSKGKIKDIIKVKLLMI